MRPRHIIFGLLALAVLAGLPRNTALAQTPTPLAYWQFSAGEVLAPYGKDAPKWRVILGPSSVYQPEYEGSDNYQVKPGMVLNIRYRGRLFISGGEGFGYDFFRGRNYRAGAALAYDRGRNDDVDGLYGLGGIDPSMQIKLYGEYVFRPQFLGREMPVILSLDLRRAVASYGGLSGNIGIYSPVAGSKQERYFVFLGGGASFVDDKTADAFFGVTAAQSASSGLPVFNPEWGIRSASIGVNAGWFFTDHMLATFAIAGKRLISDVSKSPVVQEEWQFFSSVSLGYAF
jgi:outer membrane scaffolding protein for murein synthesis (MipA/OmpV family)